MRFYKLTKPRSGDPEDLRGRTDAVIEPVTPFGPAERCRDCGRYSSALRWNPPYEIELQTWGRWYGDIVHVADELVVSSRLVEEYKDRRLSGLDDLAPASIINVSHFSEPPHDNVPAYLVALVSRTTARLDEKASGFVRASDSAACVTCRLGGLVSYEGMVVDESTWSGEDIFFSIGGFGPLVTERFREMYISLQGRGIVFEPAEHSGFGMPSERLQNR